MALTLFIYLIFSYQGAPALFADNNDGADGGFKLEEYFEHKLNGFIDGNPLIAGNEKDLSIIAAQNKTLSLFTPGTQNTSWRYKIPEGTKPEKLLPSLDHSKILIQYAGGSFDIIEASSGRLIHSAAGNSISNLLYTPTPSGFIIASGNELYCVSPSGGYNKINIAPAETLLSLKSFPAGNNFYFSVLTGTNFSIYSGSTVTDIKKISGASEDFSRSSDCMLYQIIKQNNSTDVLLKFAIASEADINIYECNNAGAAAAAQIKTSGERALKLYGCETSAGGGAVIIARFNSSYTGFNAQNGSKLFTLETRARHAFEPAIIYSENSGALFLYYDSNESIKLYNINTRKTIAEYHFEEKPSPAPITGKYYSCNKTAVFLTPLANSIMGFRIPGINAERDFDFNSAYTFASIGYSKISGANKNSPYKMLENINIEKIKEIYSSYKNEINAAAGVLSVLLLIVIIRKASRRSSNKRQPEENIETRIKRLQETLEESPENVELLANLVELLKRAGQNEQAADCYKTLIKLRPYENRYYEELFDLKKDYFQFVNELIGVYKRKNLIDDAITFFEERNTADINETGRLYAQKMLARLYIEKKIPAAENQTDGKNIYIKKAVEIIEEILKKEPSSIDELILLSQQYASIEEYEKTAVTLKKLTEIDRSSNLSNHYFNLFNIYVKLCRSEEAAEVFRTVMELKSSAAETLMPSLIDCFNDGFKTANKKDILLFGDCLVSAFNRQKNVKSALETIDKILAAYPAEKNILKRKAFLMLDNDIDNGIVDIFKKLYELYPQDLRIKYEYCRLLQRHSLNDESLALIFDALKKKESEDKYIELFGLIAASLIKEKKIQRVIELAPTAYKLSQSAICLECLAEAYLKSGDIDRAGELYQKILETDEKNHPNTLKRYKYIKTLIGERELIEMKAGAGENIELIIDGETIKVKKSSIDAESRIQANPLEIKAAEAKLHYEKGDYKKAIPLIQQFIKTAPAGKRTLLMNIYLIDCFIKESLPAAAEKIYDSIDLKSFALSAPEELAFKYKTAAIFMDGGILEKAAAVFSEIAALDMNYKNVSSIIKSIKEKIAVNTAKAIPAAASEDDSDRTIIANVANETDYIDKRYTVISQIGKGGMGIVYKALDNETRAEVAIKIPIITFKDDRSFMERFEREADVSCRLKHQNILDIHNIVKGELPYMVMELLKGRSLKEILKEKKSFTPLEMRDIAIQCCDALEYTHGLNIIHRDIKPENIMIVDSGKVKIMDFGLARALDESSVTKAGTILGTFAYISPEQCLGEQIDGRADIYSLGIMLYEMLTGEKPFTSGDYVHQHLKVKPQAPTKKNPLIPYPVETIVLKCIEKKPRDRYETAGKLKEDLLKIV